MKDQAKIDGVPKRQAEIALRSIEGIGTPDAYRIADRMRKRRCGDCRLCCTSKGVSDFKPDPKPPWMPCSALCAGGCGIYLSRPKSCFDYLCGWRMGFGMDGARPDRVGVIVDVELFRPIQTDRASSPVLLAAVVRGNDEPFPFHPVAAAIEDAFTLGVRHVGFSHKALDVGSINIPFLSVPHEIGRALMEMSKTGMPPKALYRKAETQ